ncbi:MAG: glutaredoxin family protein [Candidatus Nanohaloarchaea archaeon]
MTVEVYTTPSCPYCDKLKNWLDENGYDYEEYNVANNREKAMQMVKKTGQRGVPQTFVGDEAVIGFQPAKIEELIKEHELEEAKEERVEELEDEE